MRYYLQWSGFDFAWPLLTFTATMFIAGWLFRFLPNRRLGLFTFIVAVGYAAVLVYVDARLALVCLTSAPLVVYPLVRLGRRVRRTTRRSSRPCRPWPVR